MAGGERRRAYVYLEHQIKEMGIPNHLAKALLPHVKIVARNNSISIRDIGKILSAIALLGGDILENERYLEGWINVMITLLVSKVIQPKTYENFLSLSISEDDLELYFDASVQRRSYRINDEHNPEYDQYTMTLFYSWLYLANDGNLPGDDDGLVKFVRAQFSEWGHGLGDVREVPKKIQSDWLDLFQAKGL